MVGRAHENGGHEIKRKTLHLRKIWESMRIAGSPTKISDRGFWDWHRFLPKIWPSIWDSISATIGISDPVPRCNRKYMILNDSNTPIIVVSIKSNQMKSHVRDPCHNPLACKAYKTLDASSSPHHIILLSPVDKDSSSCQQPNRTSPPPPPPASAAEPWKRRGTGRRCPVTSFSTSSSDWGRTRSCWALSSRASRGAASRWRSPRCGAASAWIVLAIRTPTSGCVRSTAAATVPRRRWGESPWIVPGGSAKPTRETAMTTICSISWKGKTDQYSLRVYDIKLVFGHLLSIT